MTSLRARPHDTLRAILSIPPTSLCMPQHRAPCAHVYASLTPAFILEVLQCLGLWPDGRLLALNSFENRVYLVWLDEVVHDDQGESHASLVLKAYRPGRWSAEQILEEHSFARELAEQELPVVVPWNLRRMAHERLRPLSPHDGHAGHALDLVGDTLLRAGPFLIALWARQGGRAPEIDRPEVLHWIGRLVARIHQVGSRVAFEHREAFRGLDGARQALVRVAALERPMPPSRDQWLGAAGRTLDLAQKRLNALPAPRLIRVHGDMHAGNVLWTASGPHLVDLDDCRMGPAVTDLWPLLSGQGEELDSCLAQLLHGYCAIADLDHSELHWVEVLRSVRLIEHAAWIAARYDDPAFPRAFPGFAEPDFWDRRRLELEQQCSLLQDHG